LGSEHGGVGARHKESPLRPNVNGADKGKGGPESARTVVAREMDRINRARQAPRSTGLSEDFLEQTSARFPEIDVFAVAGTMREELQSGGIRKPQSVLVHRCMAAQAAVAQRAAIASEMRRGKGPGL